jgi:hypothetical protein
MWFRPPLEHASLHNSPGPFTFPFSPSKDDRRLVSAAQFSKQVTLFEAHGWMLQFRKANLLLGITYIVSMLVEAASIREAS